MLPQREQWLPDRVQRSKRASLRVIACPHPTVCRGTDPSLQGCPFENCRRIRGAIGRPREHLPQKKCRVRKARPAAPPGLLERMEGLSLGNVPTPVRDVSDSSMRNTRRKMSIAHAVRCTFGRSCWYQRSAVQYDIAHYQTPYPATACKRITYEVSVPYSRLPLF